MLVGVFCTWLVDGPVTLNGTEGPNNGWLAVLLLAPAMAWLRMMERGSLLGVTGVLGVSHVIGWTALENWLDARETLESSAAYGLLVVVAACIVLAAAALARGIELVRLRRPA